MKRVSLYSRSRPKVVAQAVPAPVKEEKKPGRLGAWMRRNRLPLLAGLPGVLALCYVLAQGSLHPASVQYTQEDIDAAVTKALETVPLPSHSTKSYEAVRGSIVRVRSFHEGPDGGEIQGGIGTGVVILDKGVILTNIHVIAGAKRISVTFETGMESNAMVTGTRPEDDLAVLQADAIPDDLMAATLQSTSGLSPGEYVNAVGFHFGIGP